MIQENTEKAWHKLLMLPKYVLPSLRRRGRHDKPPSVDYLCNMWMDNDLVSLWNLAKDRAIGHNRACGSASTNRDYTKLINQVVLLGQSGRMRKSCQLLLSSRVAENNETTWQLLNAKHPSCPFPVVAGVKLEPISPKPGFLTFFQSFPKGTAAGRSGLRVQHLLDAAGIPLPTPICFFLRNIVNILVAGKAPTLVSRFLAGENLIALNKF